MDGSFLYRGLDKPHGEVSIAAGTTLLLPMTTKCLSGLSHDARVIYDYVTLQYLKKTTETTDVDLSGVVTKN